MNQWMLSRRAMLSALGLGAVALGGRSRVARADAAPIPKRIVFVYGMGSMQGLWTPLGPGGAGAPTETGWSLGPLHAPLAGWEKKLTFVDGLDMTSATVAQPGEPNGHQRGGIAALTGAIRQSSSLAAGISIDQFIAQQINTPAPVTKVASLELSSGSSGADVEGGPHYLRAGEIVGVERDPKRSFARVFDGFVPPDNEAAKKAAAMTLAQNKSVLDFASNELTTIGARLAKSDRSKLDAHASAIRDLEARLSLATVPSPTCVPFNAADRDALAALVINKQPREGFDLDARIVASAFSCDRTRVASIHLPSHDDLGAVVGYAPGMFGTSGPHDLIHQTEGGPLTTDAAARAINQKIHVEQAKMFASLLDHLDKIPESDGRTLLDHTVILWCGQLADGSHAVEKMPYVLAGSAGGQIKTGRYLKYERVDGKGPAHNDLFVALANMMGVPITTFGEPSVCKGALPRLIT
jgi:hypothetical protein